MARLWEIVLRGGDYDGCCVETDEQPEPLIVAWRDGELARMSFDMEAPEIVLASAQVYRLVEAEPVAARATYRVGDVEPQVDARELLGASA